MEKEKHTLHIIEERLKKEKIFMFRMWKKPENHYTPIKLRSQIQAKKIGTHSPSIITTTNKQNCDIHSFFTCKE